MRGICTALFSVTVALLVAAPVALAATETAGGVAAEVPASPAPVSTTEAETGATSPTAPATTSTGKDAPVTAKTSSLTYTGPVYQKTTSGEVVAYAPATTASETEAPTGGGASAISALTLAKPDLLVPGEQAHVVDGLAAAPMTAPAAVQEIIWAGNQIVGLPYIYGGGHNATFTSPGYDCSGTVSFALHGADLLTAPDDSSQFMRWGDKGIGRWVTIFTNTGHAYMDVAGVRLDTSSANDPAEPAEGPRWRPLRPENKGYAIRHPVGL